MVTVPKRKGGKHLGEKIDFLFFTWLATAHVPSYWVKVKANSRNSDGGCGGGKNPFHGGEHSVGSVAGLKLYPQSL